MASINAHDFFAATAGVSGALIGLLFVAISVSRQRLFAHRIRAGAAMTMFMNVLIVSLFGLLPSGGFSSAIQVISAVGVGYIVMTLIAWFRERVEYPSRISALRDLLFLIGIFAVLISQFLIGMSIPVSLNDNEFNTLGVLMIICILIGISRSWELVGGPGIGISGGVTEISGHFQGHSHQEGQNIQLTQTGVVPDERFAEDK